MQIKKKTQKSRRHGPRPDYTHTSGGGEQLAKALGDTPQAQAARRLGVSPAFLNHLLHGLRTPGRAVAVKIRDTYNVPIDAW